MSDRGPRRGVRLSPHGIDTDGCHVPWRSAGLPYWEIAPARWEACVDGAASLGIRLLRLDLSWARHEITPGQLDWGEQNPLLDVPRLLEIAHARGLLVVLRPAPWLGSGVRSGDGVPRRLLALAHVRARGVGGPEPGLLSPASDQLRHESCVWLEAVAKRFASYAPPRGPVVGWIASGPGSRRPVRGGGMLDRAPESLAFHARFLSVKFPQGGAPTGAPPLTGPEGPEDLEGALAWVEAGELLHREIVGRAALARAQSEADGALIEAVHDDPPGCGADAWASHAQGVSFVLGDAARASFSRLRRLGLRASAHAPLAAVLGIPSTRSWCRDELPLPGAEAAAVLAMSGVRALDLETLLACDGLGELSAPLGPGGDPTEGSGWQRLFRMLDAIDHARLERRSDCLLLANRELGRLREACASHGALSPSLASPSALEALRVRPRPLGLLDPMETLHEPLFEGLFTGLCRAGIAFSVADTSIPEAELSRWRVAILPSCERMSPALALRLRRWVEAGGRLVLGPRVPRIDWGGRALGFEFPMRARARIERARCGALEIEAADVLEGGEPVIGSEAGPLAVRVPQGRGQVVHFGFRLPWRSPDVKDDALADVVRALLDPFDVRPCYAASDPRVETELHHGGERRFLFLANPLERLLRVTIALAPREALREVRGVGQHLLAGESFELPARSVQLRELVEL
ncbi:MAG: beta-galactosidase [Myxococcota bacterium]